METWKISATDPGYAPSESHCYTWDFPAGTSKDIIELTLKGLLFENDWCQDGILITISKED